MRMVLPSDRAFRDLPRIATSGIALRLDYEVARVERLRSVVDLAATLIDCSTSLGVTFAWTPDQLTVSFTTDKALSESALLRISEAADPAGITCEPTPTGLSLTIEA